QQIESRRSGCQLLQTGQLGQLCDRRSLVGDSRLVPGLGYRHAWEQLAGEDVTVAVPLIKDDPHLPHRITRTLTLDDLLAEVLVISGHVDESAARGIDHERPGR